MHDPFFIYALVRFMVFLAVVMIFMASQLFWIHAVRDWGKKVITSHTLRFALGAGSLVIYGLLFVYNFFWFRHEPSPTHLTISAALLEAPFRWWIISSVLGFAVVGIFWLADRLARLIHWFIRSVRAAWQPADGNADPPAKGGATRLTRRRFLERAAVGVGATPFVACAYGLTIGRLDVETTHRRIVLDRLPKAFDGFRMAQLSDLHIGPFMSAREIRRVVAMTNELKPDLMVLTGDYVTWDPSTQAVVVDVLAGLKAPLGIIGCLGNHELWTSCEDSITRLFATRDIRILRQERTGITVRGETLNFIGVDYESLRHGGPRPEGIVRHYLKGVKELMLPDTANILLSHNPNTFDRAAELGVDLSLAGHTHGGQVTLEFINKNLSPSRLITDYVRGWFSKPGGQLYVNRGIGTIGVPIRLDAPPEITVFELKRS
jgi:uncharacterized protein